MNNKALAKSWPRSLVVLALLGAGVSGATVLYSISRAGQKPEAAPSPPPVAVARKITALGRIESRSEIVSVSAPMLLDSDRVEKLLVDEGDNVRAGQVLAVLDSRTRLEDILKQAEAQVKVAESKLEQVRAGAKRGEIEANAANARELEAQWSGERETQRVAIRRLEAQLEGDVAAQEATIAKLTAEYRNAGAEYERNRQLYEEGAISASEHDAKRLSLDTALQQLNEARATLKRIERTGRQQILEAKTTEARIESTGRQRVKEALSTLNQVSEVREVDVRAARAEVESARATVKKVRTELQQAFIRAPLAGKVIRVRTRTGEQVSDEGILDLVETERMEVIVEIYQSDIQDVRVGQLARVTGSAFTGPVTGRVRLIGQRVDRQDIFSNQPGENFDRKVIPVRVALTPESGRKVAGLTNSQVTVSIEKGFAP